MEYLVEFGLFSGKVIILVSGVIAVLTTFVVLIAKNRGANKNEIKSEKLNKKFEHYKKTLESSLFSDKELKQKKKKQKKAEKDKSKKEKNSANDKSNLFVLDFNGDIKASGVDQLREEISAVLSVATSRDEVALRLESPGGMVHSYGLAAAQLLRITDKGIKLTVCVDKVAASGGYMMACTGHHIMAAPFAILGSIGVLAQIPNFNKVLKKHNVDFKEITAGEYKRTLSMFGEVTEKGVNKLTEDIQKTHDLFKDFVTTHRPTPKIEEVATGETWYGVQAVKNNLIDEVKTSDQYLLEQSELRSIYHIKIDPPKKFMDKFSSSAANALENTFANLSQRWL